MQVAWQLGALWYRGNLDEGWLPGAPLENDEIFRSVGLTSSFWLAR